MHKLSKVEISVSMNISKSLLFVNMDWEVSSEWEGGKRRKAATSCNQSEFRQAESGRDSVR